MSHHGGAKIYNLGFLNFDILGPLSSGFVCLHHLRMLTKAWVHQFMIVLEAVWKIPDTKIVELISCGEVGSHCERLHLASKKFNRGELRDIPWILNRFARSGTVCFVHENLGWQRGQR